MRSRPPDARCCSPVRASIKTTRNSCGGGGGAEGFACATGAAGAVASIPSIGTVAADGRTAVGPSTRVSAMRRLATASTRNRGPRSPKPTTAPAVSCSAAPGFSRRLFRKVPLRLPESSSHQPPPRSNTRACRPDTTPLPSPESTSSESGSLPIRISGVSNSSVSPLARLRSLR